MDSGSTDCFIDSRFTRTHRLSTYKIEPLPLTLIDGSREHLVKSVVYMPIELGCGYLCQIKCYVTELESTYPLVLGHDWLVQHNPVIDWRKKMLRLPQETLGQRTPDKEATHLSLLDPRPLDQKEKTSDCPKISFINAVAYRRACKEEGAITYQLTPDPTGHRAQAVSVGKEPLELKNLPTECRVANSGDRN